jgi:hypothetical protein
MAKAKTKVELELEARIESCAGDEERVEILKRALRFKSSWVELAEALSAAAKVESWREWGHPDFETYCRRELKLRPETAHKLVGSFGFLQQRAPDLFEREDRGTLPSLDAIDFWRRAEEEGRFDEDRREMLREVRHAVLDEGLGAPALRKRYGEQLFPVSDDEQEERDRASFLSAARRFISVLESTRFVPRRRAKELAEEVAALIAQIDDGGGTDSD